MALSVDSSEIRPAGGFHDENEMVVVLLRAVKFDERAFDQPSTQERTLLTNPKVCAPNGFRVSMPQIGAQFWVLPNPRFASARMAKLMVEVVP